MKEWSSMRNSYDVVKCLCASKFPLQLPLEEDDRRNTVLDYLIYFIEFYGTPFSTIQWIELLIELYSTNIVHHYKIRDGVSFLDKVTSKAIVESKAIVASMSEDMIYKNRSFVAFTKLLSVSSNSVENQVSKMKHCFGDVLIEAVERGYAQLVDALLEFKDSIDQLPTDVFLKIAQEAIGKGYSKCLENMLNLLKLKVGNELQQDKYGKTLFHYAAKSENEEVSGLLSRAYLEEYRVKKRDKWGRTFLHWAALTGQAYLCSTVCIGELKLKVDAKDNLGQNALHLAAKGIRGHLVVDILLKSSSANLVYATDGEGRTPLHFASAKGNIKMVEKLLENTREEKMFQQPDGFGKTALQMAAQGGHTRIVQRLLEQVSDPFLHRDAHGSTALHYATGVQDAEVALAISQSLLNKYKGGDDNRSLMLWASAAGIGTAEEREGVNPLVKDFLLQEKAGDENHLLKAAALTENVDMAWELLHRGADIADIKPSNKPWDRERDEKRIRVIKEIEIANEQGQDKPSSVDNLGRNVFAEGLAALFLNKYVESPITVGICGEWGMGKSSVMVQTENILLMAASQLSFPNLLPFENFGGAKKTLLSTKGRKIYIKMKNAAYKLFPDNSICKFLPFTRTRNQLVKLLEEYNPEYHDIYKSLACTDVQNLSSVGERSNQLQAMKEAPRILTIRYNAWHYRDEHQAWAGLAVTITKEIEWVMTRAQRFSTCWRYSCCSLVKRFSRDVLSFILLLNLFGVRHKP
ncbi:uncharacterized protein LOC131857084 [Cryptomeria japonica]|uniref:uncharacterized protein LOC131857084 n=1 Tax=Cryptomeria japonica TaxID=3369 RepID=UPI0027DA70FA|nr:uncharacterized protein LOC131857084 [Cryptomeria japonica]